MTTRKNKIIAASIINWRGQSLDIRHNTQLWTALNDAKTELTDMPLGSTMPIIFAGTPHNLTLNELETLRDKVRKANLALQEARAAS